MRNKLGILLIAILNFASADLPAPEEKHLANIRQLTFGGENAEAYFSPDGTELIFQSTREGYPCDQIYTMKIDGSRVTKISTGKGRTTCSYLYPPDSEWALYSSTHEISPTCPAPPDRSQGYVWALYPYDIFRLHRKSNRLEALARSQGYDAEATISPDGKKIVFTSDRDGDLELYAMDADGKNVRRLTHSPGYDGGAFFSYDGKKIVWRAHHITDSSELQEYQELLKKRLVKPTKLEIFVMDSDGANIQQVTHNGAANFCPYFYPDGRRIIFASNMNDPARRNFDLFSIRTDGSDLEQITFNPTFDGFPMFSPDGKHLVFASNRNAAKEGDTNIFIADWIDNPNETEEARLRRDVEFLASDQMKGRLSGTPEARKAAEYIADEFRKAGLQLPPHVSSPYQAFEFTSGIKLGTKNALSMSSATGKALNYVLSKDFIPLGYSSDASLREIPVVFANYGIRAPDLKHDDYEGLDIKGKAVIVYRFGPEGDDPKSSFALYYPLRYKAMVARELGASALLVISEDKKEDELLPLRKDSSFGMAGIAVFSLKRSIAAEWMNAAGAQFPSQDPHGRKGMELSGVRISLTSDLIREKSTSDNVLGWLPAGHSTDETIVIGAHYDHLGLGIEGSLAPKPGEVHNGADDNASGVAGLLELARFFADKKSQLPRNLLFVGFGGEELGVLGSGYFVKNPVIPLQQIVAMLNMDMIGRLRDEKLIVGGTGTSPDWKQILEKENVNQLKLTFNEDGYGPSDHALFYAKDIPVLFFFTGAHSEYHTPADDSDRIAYDGMVKIVNYIEGILEDILATPARPQFTRVKSSSQEIATRGFRVYLGTIPDYGEEVKGVKLTGVREASPAQKAGIQAGDIIVEFGGTKVENIYDYTYALQQHKPGDIVPVVILRGSQRLTVNVTLEKRAATE